MSLAFADLFVESYPHCSFTYQSDAEFALKIFDSAEKFKISVADGEKYFCVIDFLGIGRQVNFTNSNMLECVQELVFMIKNVQLFQHLKSLFTSTEGAYVGTVELGDSMQVKLDMCPSNQAPHARVIGEIKYCISGYYWNSNQSFTWNLKSIGDITRHILGFWSVA